MFLLYQKKYPNDTDQNTDQTWHVVFLKHHKSSHDGLAVTNQGGKLQGPRLSHS